MSDTSKIQWCDAWIGVRVENQAMAEKRIPELLKIPLLKIPAKIRFVVAEPLLGPIDFYSVINEDGDGPARDLTWIGADGAGIDWVIVGGESGPKARPCNVEWIRLIIRQCAAAGVPCFVKQLGRNPEWSDKDMEEKWYKRFYDPSGGDPAEWPFDLRVRQFPKL